MRAKLTPDFMTLPMQLKPASPKGLYAAFPGTGPEGETCGSCKHLYRKHMGNTYLKCMLTKAKWMGGGGTRLNLNKE